jgi:hypothetical protein
MERNEDMLWLEVYERNGNQLRNATRNKNPVPATTWITGTGEVAFRLA